MIVIPTCTVFIEGRINRTLDKKVNVEGVNCKLIMTKIAPQAMHLKDGVPGLWTT